MRTHPHSSFLAITLYFLSALAFFGHVHAQSQSATSAHSSSTSTSNSAIVVSGNFTTTITTTSSSHTIVLTSTLPTSFTLTPSASTSANATATSSTSTPTSTQISLDTRIDPGFGVLGAILIITGLPSTFLGHKNRWSSFFLIGFYTLSLACLALILKFGVLEAVNSPSDTLRGVFVLACCVAGIAGGGFSIFFWKQAKYFIGGWGGFAIGLWVQCFRNGGLIHQIGFRWLMYLGLAVVGFCLCTVPKIHYHVLLASTACVGASAFILGVDCYTTANLKEFYVWNLGFNSLFTKFQNAGIQFPVSQMMEIELGLIGAFTLIGAAVQLRVLRVLQYKLKEITKEQKKREAELEAQATDRYAETAKDLEDWEKLHGRKDSHLSGFPLLKDQEASSPATEDTQTLVMGTRRSRYESGVSDFMAASPPLEDEYGRPRDRRQSVGTLPALDLGSDLEHDIPKDFVADNLNTTSKMGKNSSTQEKGDLKTKEELLAEIQTIRRSIDQLRAATPGSSASDERSRRQSFASRRTLSLGFAEALEGPQRPPRAQDPRLRASSMDLYSQLDDRLQTGPSISRPSSVPLQEENWDDYVRERKLFQPPAGVTPPITTTPIAPQPKRPPVAVPNSVSDALLRRHHQEAVIETGEFGLLDRHTRESSHTSSDEQPLAKALTSQKSATIGTHAPVTILPPRKPEPASQPTRPPAPRVRTFEELNERHREKMRDLQAPLSRAEREHAELSAARSRWERSKEIERQVMMKREAEKAAAAKQAEKRRASGGDVLGIGSSPTKQHGRSLSAELGKIPGAGSGGSKRQSMLKVEDWRRYQQEMEVTESSPEGASKRDSTVPFPAVQTSREPGHHPSNERRKSTQLPRGPSH